MRIHRNLHNARRGGPQWVSTLRGRVDQYLDSVALVNVSTRVQPAGVAKAHASQARNVCAYFDGTSVDVDISKLAAGVWLDVCFDPRKDDFFFTRELGAFNRAAAVFLLDTGKAVVLQPTWVEDPRAFA